MNAYGVSGKDAGCCPGDKYAAVPYECTRAHPRRARLRPAKKHARSAGRIEIRRGMEVGR